jgi:hypothetical protein
MAGYHKIVMKSRMMGDYQVRFCERLGLKCPGILDNLFDSFDNLFFVIPRSGRIFFKYVTVLRLAGFIIYPPDLTKNHLWAFSGSSGCVIPKCYLVRKLVEW